MSSWGFYAHKKIHQHAIYTLPEPLFSFYKKVEKQIIADAVKPDSRRYIDTLEGARHYLDVENFPIDINLLPKYRKEAINIFGEHFLDQNGSLPWQIQYSYDKLKQAFYDKDAVGIIKHSADLGHYLADAHVPLHTTHNYNGQFSNQKGIHAFWESRIPELFAANYDLLTGGARYYPDIALQA